MTNDVKYFSADVLKTWLHRLFERLMVPPDDAAIVAAGLVNTSLRGVDTHGVIYARTYAQRIRKGYIKAQPNIRIERENPTALLMDGDNGLGIVVGVRAMSEAIRRAREMGTAMVAVHNSTHFGATAHYAQMAAAEGLIGLSCTNTEAVMAPWGGRSPLLGSNPLAIAVPGGIEGGLVLDMSTTAVSWGKMYLAARAGEKIPLDWATDKNGQPTDDPNVGMAGLMLPLGGYKGYGLSLMIEILCSTLTGAAYTHEVVHEQNLGQCFIAIDISRFIPLKAFQARLDQLVDAIHTSETREDVSRIYVPGEIEAETMARRQQEGIPIPIDIVAELEQLGDEFGEPFLRQS